jgi:transcriptional regulator of arginine metabolism
MTETPDKVRRHRAIRSLVREGAVSSQDDLVRRLARHGHDVTQATLSRDLRELRISRVPIEDGYRYVESAPAFATGAAGGAGLVAETRSMRSVAALEVTGVEANESCVVVRTLIGRAQGVAAWLDQLALPDLLATIAGDDTILAVPRSARRTRLLKKQLETTLGLEPPARRESGPRRTGTSPRRRAPLAGEAS